MTACRGRTSQTRGGKAWVPGLSSATILLCDQSGSCPLDLDAGSPYNPSHSWASLLPPPPSLSSFPFCLRHKRHPALLNGTFVPLTSLFWKGRSIRLYLLNAGTFYQLRTSIPLSQDIALKRQTEAAKWKVYRRQWRKKTTKFLWGLRYGPSSKCLHYREHTFLLFLMTLSIFWLDSSYDLRPPLSSSQNGEGQQQILCLRHPCLKASLM